LNVTSDKKFHINPKTLNQWNQIMCFHGLAFKSRDKLNEKDLSSIKSLLNKFLSATALEASPLCSFYHIPSDTGLVALTLSGTLTAIKNIKESAIITYLTVSKAVQFLCNDNLRLFVGTHSATIVKQISPFCGFGSFAKWVPDDKANCKIVVRCSQSNSYLFALKATMPISKGSQILCSKKPFLPPPSCAFSDNILDLLGEVKKRIRSSPQIMRSSVV